MLVLGVDSALKSCSAAILKDGAVLAERALFLEKGHAELLAPMVAEVLAEARVAARDLDRIGVVIGPGGFAGVRVGLAFARGLALGTRIKVVGVTSLAALAAGVTAPARGLVAPIIDARRAQVYAALYGQDGSIRLPPFVASPEEAAARLVAAAAAEPVVLVGDGAVLIAPSPTFVVPGGGSRIDAKVVARLAAHAAEPSAPPSPLYLRPPDAKPGKRSLFEGLLGDLS
ncbi:MAG: tRNA (adenosine(37)-N6)-threonylcarbamoyltransferase complex dimerization subunit type 1 TsaB [Parvularculaceae bacterium]